MSIWAGQALWGAVVMGALLVASVGSASVPSGNELALYLKEAKTPAARKMLLDEALGKPHFFRYLQIEELQPGESGGAPYMDLIAREPSSSMRVRFKVVKSLSLATLKEAPVSAIGDAIAVTGVIESMDSVKRELVLNPVIVRYKDRLAPKVGKEMHYERDNSGIVYSFTGGKEPVNVSKRDEDLVKHEGRIIAERGKDGWAKFLLDEIAKRDKAAKAERDKLGIYRKESAPEPVAPVEWEAPATDVAPVQSVITDDED